VLARKEFDEELETSGYNRKHTLQNIYNRNPNSIMKISKYAKHKKLVRDGVVAICIKEINEIYNNLCQNLASWQTKHIWLSILEYA
jgi:hypothetical protein